MNYELAKKLKDAGFFQAGDGFALVIDNPELFESPEDASMTVIPWNKYVYSPTEKYGPTMYAPTLSELIEACGDRFYELANLGKDNKGIPVWQAKDLQMKEGINGNGLWQMYRGSTPEEAVAYLYLSLKGAPVRSAFGGIGGAG